MTPLIRTRTPGGALGAHDLWVKDEGINPTGSFKARGLSCAISMCHRARNPQGRHSVGRQRRQRAWPPTPPRPEWKRISSCRGMFRNRTTSNARRSARRSRWSTASSATAAGSSPSARTREGWFDVSTLKEPYRIEGKKTMGYELAEQFRWQLPDAIFYPTGGGVGLIGMWKAFEEMEALGWIGAKRPKMIAVQAEAARRWCARSSEATAQQVLGGRLIPSRAACECPSRWAIS